MSQRDENLNFLASNFAVWYPDVALWIEPANKIDHDDDPAEGYLHVFLAEMIEMRDRIEGWLAKDYVGSSNEEVWCVPPASNSLVQPDESATFDSNGNGVIGDIEDIVACLDHNVNFDGGNAVRFQACYDACNACAGGGSCASIDDVCGGTPTTYLPRSLIPGFDPNGDFVPVDTAQLAIVLACPGICSACNTDCNDDYVNICVPACGGPLDPGYATCITSCNTAKSDCEGNCTCNPPGLNCQTLDVAAEAEASKGSCGSTLPDSYLDFLQRSIPEAANQVAKFQKRRDFLDSRATEAKAIVDIFDPAIVKFDEFLNGLADPDDSPVEKLIELRDNFKPGKHGLPYHAIYGWKDEDDPSGTPEGKWHIVKVEARSLNHCDNRCAGNQTSRDPGWPRIKSYTKSWGMKRCYKLVNVLGSVKFRTIRYDEEKKSGLFRFPNGVPIWNFRTAHPKILDKEKRTQDIVRPGGLAGACLLPGDLASPTIDVFEDNSSTDKIYHGAFMMNKWQVSNAACWDLAHKLLTLGVVTETCAKYNWMGSRMNFKFVPCKDF